MAEENQTNTSASTTTTTVTVEDINELLGMPGAENIMTSATGKQEEAKPNLFSAKPVDLSFLDKPDDEESDDTSGDKAKEKPAATVEEIKAQLDAFANTSGEEEEAAAGKTGRPKTDKSALIELTKKMIADKKLIPFKNEKGEEENIDNYTIKDIEELMEANFEEKERKLRQEIPGEFFNNLPREMQAAHKYLADGGQDMKGLFRALAQVEEVRQMDPTDENDQEGIVRAYLTATGFADAEDIETEIDALKDRGELENKATKFKPKLDAMQQEIVAQKMHQQESMRKQQEAQAKMYMDNVYEALSPGELNGLKLDKKTQSSLYAGLVQPEYPSISGKRTNLLGHLLEKYQWVEPRHDLIAEALWLLSDPDGYRSKVKEGGKKEATEKTVRMLKTEEASKTGSSSGEDDDTNHSREKKQTLSRPQQVGGFFKRGS
jgi:hypothetical protein